MPESNDPLAKRLRLACAKGQVKEAQKLLRDHGWGRLCPVDENPLRRAADDGNDALCKILIDHGAPVNGFDRGHAPLHSAAMMGRTSTCHLLLSHGADLDLARPLDGRLAEHLALDADRSETVHFFRAIRAASAARDALKSLSSENLGPP